MRKPTPRAGRTGKATAGTEAVEAAPDRVDFTKLVPLGPVAAARWKFRHEGLPHELCLEEWRLPDGRNVVEVSNKASQPETAAAQAALDGFLAELGIDRETRAQTKTLTALEHFAAKSKWRRSNASR